jgi:hypothetical protein
MNKPDSGVSQMQLRPCEIAHEQYDSGSGAEKRRFLFNCRLGAVSLCSSGQHPWTTP